MDRLSAAVKLFDYICSPTDINNLDPELLLILGNFMFNQPSRNSYDSMFTFCNLAYKKGCKDAAIPLSHYHMSHGDVSADAIKIYEIAADKGNREIMSFVGNYYWDQSIQLYNSTEKQNECFEKAIKYLNPISDMDHNVAFKIGAKYLELFKYKEAIIYYEKGIMSIKRLKINIPKRSYELASCCMALSNIYFVKHTNSSNEKSQKYLDKCKQYNEKFEHIMVNDVVRYPNLLNDVSNAYTLLAQYYSDIIGDYSKATDIYIFGILNNNKEATAEFTKLGQKYTFAMTYGKNRMDACPICYEFRFLLTLSCHNSHKICMACLNKITSNTNKCPICQTKIIKNI